MPQNPSIALLSSINNESSNQPQLVDFPKKIATALLAMGVVGISLAAVVYFALKADSDTPTPSPLSPPSSSLPPTFLANLVDIFLNITLVDCSKVAGCSSFSWTASTTCSDVLAHPESNHHDVIRFPLLQLLAFYYSSILNYSTQQMCLVADAVYPCGEMPPINTDTGPGNCSGVPTCFNIAKFAFIMDPTFAAYRNISDICTGVQNKTNPLCNTINETTLIDTTKHESDSSDNANLDTTLTMTCRQ